MLKIKHDSLLSDAVISLEAAVLQYMFFLPHLKLNREMFAFIINLALINSGSLSCYTTN